MEDSNPGVVVQRAQQTTVLGDGRKTAVKYYSCFSFVGGLIYKKSLFDQYNTDKHDGSIYSQIYLGCLMVSHGCRLFSIKEPLILKDIYMVGKNQNSYRDKIARKWKDYRIVDGGMPSVINVVISAVRDAGVLNQASVYTVFNRVYSLTYPHWILDYKSNGAIPEAVGLMVGMSPAKNANFSTLNIFKTESGYLVSTISLPQLGL